MSIFKLPKSERKWIASLLLVLVIEVATLLTCGIISYKEERIESKAKGRELVRRMWEQQEEDWKELEGRRIETDALTRELARAEEEIEKLKVEGLQQMDDEARIRLAQQILLLNSQNKPRFIPFLNLRNWDFPAVHPYGPRLETDVIIKSPRPFSGKPFLKMDRGLLLRLEESATERRDPRND